MTSDTLEDEDETHAWEYWQGRAMAAETLLHLIRQMEPGTQEWVDGKPIDALAKAEPDPAADTILMPREDVNNLDDVVRELGIEDTDTTPAEAVRDLKAEIERLRANRAVTAPSEEDLRTALKELADASEYDMHLNQGGDNHDDEPEGSGGWWSTRTDNAIRKARAVLATPCSPGNDKAETVSKLPEDIAESDKFPAGLHPRTKTLVRDFAQSLAAKLRKAEERYGYGAGWLTEPWEAECKQHFRSHIMKGDPLDVAAYCAFMWRRGWSTYDPDFALKIDALLKRLVGHEDVAEELAALISPSSPNGQPSEASDK